MSILPNDLLDTLAFIRHPLWGFGREYGMAEKGFTGQSFLWRLIFAIILVGVTYNPEGY